MGVLLEQCYRCGSTKQNSGLASGICPDCGKSRELVIGPGGNNYGKGFTGTKPNLRELAKSVRETVIKVNGTDEGVLSVDEMIEKMQHRNEKRLQTVEDALEGG